MSSFTGETKTSSSTTTNSPSFYTHKLPHPNNKYLIDNTPFQRSARGCREFRRLNPSLLHTGPLSSCPPCNCNYVKPFLSGHRFCDACHKDLGNERYAQEMHLLDIVKQEDSGVSTNDHARKLHSLGIRLSALVAFAYAHDCWDWPTWMIVRDIVKPATKVKRCRYGELPDMKDCFGPATVFMSHCWGAKFGDLIGAACHGARTDRVVWIDIFAVRQWPGNDADLNFRGVIRRCAALVVSTSPVDGLKKWDGVGSTKEEADKFLASYKGKLAKKATPFFRLWCIVELAAAIQSNVPIVVKGGRVKISYGIYEYDTKCIGQLMDNLMHMIDVDSSECSLDADKVREMAVVRRSKGGLKGVNALVAGVVAGASQSVHFNILEIDTFVCNEPESFRALNIPLGCKGRERDLAIRVLKAVGAGGRESIVQELFLKWNVKEDDDQNKKGASDFAAMTGASIETANYYIEMAGGTIEAAVTLYFEFGGAPAPSSSSSKTKRNGSLKKEKEKKRKWLIQLIDDSKVLWMASGGGHVGVIEKILEVVGINVNRVHSGGCTPLSVASDNGHLATVKVLIEAGGNVNQAATDNGSSPLWVASQNGNVDIVRVLIEKGGNINQHNNRKATPLFVASYKGHTDVVRLLLRQPHIEIHKNPRGASAIGEATKKNHTEIVQLLIKAGCNVNQARTTHDMYGTSLLHMASQNNHVDTVKVLIQAGGNVNQADNDGYTPLYAASEIGNVDLAKLLINAGSNVNQHSNKNATPLFIASINGDIDVVRLLLRQPHIDIHTNPRDATAIGTATENNYTQIIQLLKDAGAK
jgi:ankyrin repeat protein